MPSKTKAAKELFALVARYGLEPFLESTRTLAGVLNSDGRLTSSNAALEALRRTLSDAAELREFVAPASRPDFERLLADAHQTREQVQGQLDFGLETQPRRYACLLVPLSDGRLLFFGEPVFTAFDLPEKYQRLIENFHHVNDELRGTLRELERKETELKAVIAQADEVSHTDALTFLPNRKQVIADLQRQVTFSDRYGTPLSISMLDFDNFKLVNDKYGHAVGDDVLRFVAMQLREHIRLPDMVGRYGGEEFLVLLPNSTLKAASEQAARLCEQVRITPIISGSHAIRITISIGIAQYRIHEEDWEQLLRRSDQALYQAKKNGRDQWAVIEA